jgi:hypothetical protein
LGLPLEYAVRVWGVVAMDAGHDATPTAIIAARLLTATSLPKPHFDRMAPHASPGAPPVIPVLQRLGQPDGDQASGMPQV